MQQDFSIHLAICDPGSRARSWLLSQVIRKDLEILRKFAVQVR
jgi:hypothetical protein